jgi:hypothetical protein
MAKKKVPVLEAFRIRDEVLSNICKSSKEWMDIGIAHIEALPEGLYTGESIRFALTENGFPHPEKSNHWGALIKLALNRGILELSD